MAFATPEEREKLLRTLKFEIQSLLSTEKESITAYQLLRNYRNEVGGDPPFAKLGYRTLEQLLLAMPEYVSCRTGPDGLLYVKAVPTEETRHINELVSGQRKKKSKGKRPSYYGGRYSARPATGSYRYPSTPFAPRFQPNWKPAPVRTPPTNFQASGTESNYNKAPSNTSWQYRDSQVRQSANYAIKKYPVCFSAWKAPTPEPPKEPEVPPVVINTVPKENVTSPLSPASIKPQKQNYYQDVSSVAMNGWSKDPAPKPAYPPTSSASVAMTGWSGGPASQKAYPPTSSVVLNSSSVAANTRAPMTFFNPNGWSKEHQTAPPTSSGSLFGATSTAVKSSTLSNYYQDVSSAPMKDWSKDSVPLNAPPTPSGLVSGAPSAATKPSTSPYYQDVPSVPMKELLKEPAPPNSNPSSSSAVVGTTAKPVIPYYHQNGPTVAMKGKPMESAPLKAQPPTSAANNYFGCRPKEYSSIPFQPPKLVASQAPERSIDPSLKITIQPMVDLIKHAQLPKEPEFYYDKPLKDKVSQWEKEDLVPLKPGVFRAQSLERSFSVAQEAAQIHDQDDEVFQDEKPVETKFIRTMNHLLPATYRRPSLAELEAAQITSTMKNLSLKSITRTVTQQPVKKELLTPPSSPEPVAGPKMPVLVPQQPTAKRYSEMKPTVSYLELLRRLVESKCLGHVMESTYECRSGRFIGRVEVNFEKFSTFPSEFDTAVDALEEAAREAFVALQIAPSAY